MSQKKKNSSKKGTKPAPAPKPSKAQKAPAKVKAKPTPAKKAAVVKKLVPVKKASSAPAKKVPAAKAKPAAKPVATKTAKPAPVKSTPKTAPKPTKSSALASTPQSKKNSSAQIVTSVVSKPRFPIGRHAPANPVALPRDPVKKSEPQGAQKQKLTKKFIDLQHQRLLELRDHILDQMHDVAADNLSSNEGSAGPSAFGMHQADAGSDAYEKDFALSLLSKEQDALYEIDEAIARIENGTYGICEMSNEPIPLNRLEAVPFARYTTECQDRFEKENKGRGRWDTSPQFMDNTDNFYEEDEEPEEDSSAKSKDA